MKKRQSKPKATSRRTGLLGLVSYVSSEDEDYVPSSSKAQKPAMLESKTPTKVWFSLGCCVNPCFVPCHALIHGFNSCHVGLFHAMLLYSCHVALFHAMLLYFMPYCSLFMQTPWIAEAEGQQAGARSNA
jgi:hypothetical protein